MQLRQKKEELSSAQGITHCAEQPQIWFRNLSLGFWSALACSVFLREQTIWLLCSLCNNFLDRCMVCMFMNLQIMNLQILYMNPFSKNTVLDFLSILKKINHWTNCKRKLSNFRRTQEKWACLITQLMHRAHAAQVEEERAEQHTGYYT